MTDKPADTCKQGRDKTGRWLPGHSGNPKGAIKNRLSMTLDERTHLHLVDAALLTKLTEGEQGSEQL